MRNTVHRVALAALSLLVATAGLLLPGPTPVIALAGDRRPNLQMIRLRDWQIDTSGDRRRLRFTTIFVNAGRGPFELRGHRSSKADPTMDIDQVMYRWDGTTRRIHTRAVAKYSGDGHDHWHVQNVVVYEAWRIGDLADTRRGAKTGFCFFDTTPWRRSLPGARQSGYYQQEWCGTRSVLSNRVGLSVGWGDRYPWNFAFQWIDITGLDGGRYRVRATVDIADRYDESVETDNCVWAIVDIPDPGSGSSVQVENNGFGCGEDAITAVTTYPDAETWEPPRDVVFQPAVHVGYRFNSRGTELDRVWRRPTTARPGAAASRATPPGRTGHWLYIVSGPYAGYWFRDSPDIDFVP
jgi:hypothetical protein